MGRKKRNTGNSPTLAQCRNATENNLHYAVILQKLCHYAVRPPIEIEGKMYTAPTTEMLLEELGGARSTIQRAIKFCQDAGLIEVRHKVWNRSKRRYIRILWDWKAELEGRPSPTEKSYATATVTEPSQRLLGSTSPSVVETVQDQDEKKKKIQTKPIPDNQGVSNPFGGNSPTPLKAPPSSKNQGIPISYRPRRELPAQARILETLRAGNFAKTQALKKGWTKERENELCRRALVRLIRERIRKEKNGRFPAVFSR